MPDTTTLTLSFAANQLTATWAAVDGVSAYDFELLDADGLPVPGTSQYGLQVTMAQVSGNLVGNALTYTADVQAIAESVWSAQSTVLDKIDPLLKALEQRLNAALVNQQVPLNAQTLDSQELTDLLALLIDADHPTLMVSRAQIFRGPNNSSINVTGQSVLPGNVQVTSVKAVFEVA